MVTEATDATHHRGAPAGPALTSDPAPEPRPSLSVHPRGLLPAASRANTWQLSLDTCHQTGISPISASGQQLDLTAPTTRTRACTLEHTGSPRTLPEPCLVLRLRDPQAGLKRPPASQGWAGEWGGTLEHVSGTGSAWTTVWLWGQ